MHATEALATATLIFATACYARTTYLPPPTPVPRGELVTEGVAIWAKDSEFRIDAGVPFSTPFFAESCVDTATPDNYRQAHAMGARPVVVSVPHLPQPIYGLLAFCRVPPEATGPATRSYQVKISDHYAMATDGGRVAVEMELTNYQDAPAWQLWLSRSPSLWE